MRIKDFTSFFSAGMGWPVLIFVIVLILLVIVHPFDGTTMQFNQPLAILCRIQSENCSTECSSEFVSAAENCNPIQFGRRRDQVIISNKCPCKDIVLNNFLQQKIEYTGTTCKYTLTNCTCTCNN